MAGAGTRAGLTVRAREILARADADPSGLLAAGVVFVACALTALVLWYPLGLPSELTRNVIAQPTVICYFRDFIEADEYAGTPRMYLCSWATGFLTMAGPIVLVAVAFVFRKALARILTAIGGRLPRESSFLVAPLVATILFTTAWSGSHYTTAWKVGFLPQTLFPGVVGLFTFAVLRWGPAVQSRLAPFFDIRDRYPMKVRIALAFLIPMGLTLFLTLEKRVSSPAVKEQLVVLVGLVTAFLALTPRSGDVMSGVRERLATVAQQVRVETRQRVAQLRSQRQ